VTATNALVGTNLVVFALMVASGASPIFPGVDHLLRWGATFGPLPPLGQCWRLVTSSFVHIGIVHLITNMLFLWWFGRTTERIFGPCVTICVYFLTAIGGELLSLSWNSLRVSAGASGAIFGMAGTMIAALSYAQFKLPETRLSRRRAITFVAIGLTLGLLPGIDNMAHFGGLLTGALLGSCAVQLLRRPSPRRTMLAVAVLSRARMAIEKSDYDSAAEDLSVYCASRPYEAYGHALFGYSLQNSGQYDRAAVEYVCALSLRAEDLVTEVNLAGILVRQGKTDDAVNLLQNGYFLHSSTRAG
jgi:membrane associated rhomboid family serine protease